MRICIERGLEGIKKSLEKRGHKVHYNNSIYSDVYIYMHNSDGLMNNSFSNVSLGYGEKMNNTLLIDAKNKSISQIEAIISNSMYSDII